MKQHLQLLDYALWVATICLQWIAVAVASRREIRNRLPAFWRFLLFIGIRSSVLLAISQLFSYNVYFWTFYTGIAVESILLMSVVYEIFGSTFNPIGVLPAGSVARMITFLIVAASVITTFAFWRPAHTYDPITNFLRTSHRSIAFVVAFSLWSLVFYARSLAIPWISTVARVATGFLVCLSAQSFTRAGQTFAAQAWFPWLDRMSSAAFIATLLIWIGAVLRKEDVSLDLPAPEALRKLSTTVAEMRAAARSVKAVPSFHPKLKEE